MSDTRVSLRIRFLSNLYSNPNALLILRPKVEFVLISEGIENSLAVRFPEDKT
jgi:hypothetical protein